MESERTSPKALSEPASVLNINKNVPPSSIHPRLAAMSFYTAATVLPRAPDAFKMNATIRLNSWASWRSSSSSKTPLTPPLTSTFQPKVLQPHVERMVLPPIAHLERNLPPCTLL